MKKKKIDNYFCFMLNMIMILTAGCHSSSFYEINKPIPIRPSGLILAHELSPQYFQAQYQSPNTSWYQKFIPKTEHLIADSKSDIFLPHPLEMATSRTQIAHVPEKQALELARTTLELLARIGQAAENGKEDRTAQTRLLTKIDRKGLAKSLLGFLWDISDAHHREKLGSALEELLLIIYKQHLSQLTKAHLVSMPEPNTSTMSNEPVPVILKTEIYLQDGDKIPAIWTITPKQTGPKISHLILKKEDFLKQQAQKIWQLLRNAPDAQTAQIIINQEIKNLHSKNVSEGTKDAKR